MAEYNRTEELINVLKDIRDEMKVTNDKLEKIEVSLNHIREAFP